jgi:hypothetical protein
MPVINQVGNSLTGLTGTGTFVGANTPTLITPVLGAATGTSLVLSGKLTANNSINGFATTATAAATTTLTVSSAQIQEFTGSTTQTLVMPVTSTLVTGQQYYIINNSSGVVTVQSSGTNTIQAMAANTSLLLTVVNTAVTTAAGWESAYISDTGLAGAVLLTPSGDQTITTGNLSLTTGSYIAGTILPGNLSLTGNTISSTNSNGNISLIPNGTGSCLLNTTTAIIPSGQCLQMASFNNTPFVNAAYNTIQGAGPQTNFYRSRSSTVGSYTTTINGDVIGTMSFFGDDGTQFTASSYIQCQISDVVSTNIVPSGLIFGTSNAGGSRVNALILDKNQVATFTNPIVTSGINDVNGNRSVLFGSVASAVNYVAISNGSTGNSVSIAAQSGTDLDVKLVLSGKASGMVAINSLSSTPFQIASGTTYQHTTNFAFANTAQTRTVTFPDASFTIAQAGANSDITSLTGLNGVIQAPTFINDVNGNHVLGFISQSASSVNYLQVSATNTLIGPQLNAVGTDTDISMYLMPKGSGTVNISVTSNIGLFIRSGTTFQHATQFVFANTAQARTVTFPDADGTVQFQGQSLGATVITAPAASQASALTLGSAYQNPFGYDVVLTVYVAVTAATAGSISVGVGPTNTPTQQNVVTGFTIAALSIIPVTIYLPASYYALLSLTSVTGSISGQQAMPV